MLEEASRDTETFLIARERETTCGEVDEDGVPEARPLLEVKDVDPTPL
jgi:hypothetical protein